MNNQFVEMSVNGSGRMSDNTEVVAMISEDNNQINQMIDSFDDQIKTLDEKEENISLKRLKAMFDTEMKLNLDLEKALDSKSGNESNTGSDRMKSQTNEDLKARQEDNLRGGGHSSHSTVRPLTQQLKREKKSSFERFGEKLMELIVSYLPIEDKFRFECLSKQFRRLIFNKQYVLDISAKEKTQNSIEMNMFTVEGYKNWCETTFKWFAANKLDKFIKKLNNLSHICIDGSINFNSGLIFDVIADNCHRLRRLTIRFERIRFPYRKSELKDNNSFTKLIEICGQNLEYLDISRHSWTDGQNLKNLLSLTPNLVALKVDHYWDHQLLLSFQSLDGSTDKTLPKLREFHCSQIGRNDLIAITNLYHNQLVRLGFTVSSDMADFDRFTSGQYPRLESLELRIDNTFLHRLPQLGANCPKLTRLVVTISWPLPENYDFLSTFSSLTRLTSLEVRVISYHKVLNTGTLAHLRQSPRLRQLKIVNMYLSDGALELIGQYFPGLECLIIQTNSVLTNETLEYISHLTGLKSLEINSYHKKEVLVINDFGVNQLMNYCRHLRRLVLMNSNGRVQKITTKTIELFERKAKQMPRIRFYLRFNANYKTVMNSRFVMNNLTNNLRIDLN